MLMGESLSFALALHMVRLRLLLDFAFALGISADRFGCVPRYVRGCAFPRSCGEMMTATNIACDSAPIATSKMCSLGMVFN